MTDYNSSDGVKKELENLVRRGGFLVVPGTGLERPLRVGVGGYDQVLLHEAMDAARRAQAAFGKDDITVEAGATAAAVLCAAAACEAWLSEHLSRREFYEGKLLDNLEQIRRNWNAREQWRLLLREAAPRFDCGTSTAYRALGCLFRVRDVVAHRNARIADLDSLPEGLNDCVRQGALPIRDATGVDWTSVVFVHEVATWAADTAKDWLDLVYQLVPRTC